jgi:hypothetical protein
VELVHVNNFITPNLFVCANNLFRFWIILFFFEAFFWFFDPLVDFHLSLHFHGVWFDHSKLWVRGWGLTSSSRKCVNKEPVVIWNWLLSVSSSNRFSRCLDDLVSFDISPLIYPCQWNCNQNYNDSREEDTSSFIAFLALTLIVWPARWSCTTLWTFRAF